MTAADINTRPSTNSQGLARNISENVGGAALAVAAIWRLLTGHDMAATDIRGIKHPHPNPLPEERAPGSPQTSVTTGIIIGDRRVALAMKFRAVSRTFAFMSSGLDGGAPLDHSSETM